MTKTFVKNQLVQVSTFRQLCQQFGVQKSGRHCCADFGTTRSIWGPCIPKHVKSGWNNVSLRQNDLILEWNDNIDKDTKIGNKVIEDVHQVRITFRRYKNAYTFLGVYQLDKNLTKGLEDVRVWKRIENTFTVN